MYDYNSVDFSSISIFLYKSFLKQYDVLISKPVIINPINTEIKMNRLLNL